MVRYSPGVRSSRILRTTVVSCSWSVMQLTAMWKPWRTVRSRLRRSAIHLVPQ